MQTKRDLLFGKALQHLVTTALLNLQNSQKNTVLISEISVQIFKDRPELQVYNSDAMQKYNLHKRILHICKKLQESNILEMEQKRAGEIATKYFIIYTKTN